MIKFTPRILLGLTLETIGTKTANLFPQQSWLNRKITQAAKHLGTVIGGIPPPSTNSSFSSERKPDEALSNLVKKTQNPEPTTPSKTKPKIRQAAFGRQISSHVAPQFWPYAYSKVGLFERTTIFETQSRAHQAGLFVLDSIKEATQNIYDFSRLKDSIKKARLDLGYTTELLWLHPDTPQSPLLELNYNTPASFIDDLILLGFHLSMQNYQALDRVEMLYLLNSLLDNSNDFFSAKLKLLIRQYVLDEQTLIRHWHLLMMRPEILPESFGLKNISALEAARALRLVEVFDPLWPLNAEDSLDDYRPEIKQAILARPHPVHHGLTLQ